MFSQLEIDGRGVLTVGIAMTDVNLALDSVTIHNLGGADGEAGAVDGDDVTAISLAGAGSLRASQLRIAQLIAGSGYTTYTWAFEEDYRGGDASGIAVTGTYMIQIDNTLISGLVGGDAGSSTEDPYGCHGRGGQAVGIATDGSDVRLDQITIRELRGGKPCSGLAQYCDYRAGAYRGISVRGGTLTVTDSRLSDFSARAAHRSPVNAGIFVQDTRDVVLDGVRLEPRTTSLVANASLVTTPRAALRPDSPDSPYCVEPPLSVYAMRVQNADQVSLNDLSIRNVWGGGYGGKSGGHLYLCR